MSRSNGPQSFKRSDLRDTEFFRRNHKAIMRAAAAGEIVDDIPPRSQTTPPRLITLPAREEHQS